MAKDTVIPPCPNCGWAMLWTTDLTGEGRYRCPNNCAANRARDAMDQQIDENRGAGWQGRQDDQTAGRLQAARAARAALVDARAAERYDRFRAAALPALVTIAFGGRKEKPDAFEWIAASAHNIAMHMLQSELMAQADTEKTGGLS